MAVLRKPALSTSTNAGILGDHYDKDMTAYALAKKYCISEVTAMKVIRELPPDYIVPPVKVIIALVLRGDFSLIERIKNIAKLAMNIVHLPLCAMMQILTNHTEKLNPSQLTQLMTAATPYVLAKVENKTKVEKSSMPIVFKIFKDNLNIYIGN